MKSSILEHQTNSGPMSQNEFIIEYHAERRPFNCHMVLPLPLLKRLTIIIKDPIMKGLVDSDKNGRVLLYIHVDTAMMAEVEDAVREFEKEVLSMNRRA
jgi:hypothetical protein